MGIATTSPQRLGDVLVARGYLTEEQLLGALNAQQEGGRSKLLGEVIVEQELCSEDQVVECLALVYGVLARMVGYLDEAVDQFRTSLSMVGLFPLQEGHIRHELAETLYLRNNGEDRREARAIWVDALEKSFFEQSGVNVINIKGLGKPRGVGKVLPEDFYAFAKAQDQKDAEALFLSCMGLRTLDFLSKLEKDLGKPVLSSNQVSLWMLFRLCNIPLTAIRCDFGSLFRYKQKI